MVTRYWRVLLLVFLLMGIGAYQLYGIFSNQGYQPQQPINFSHVIHAGVLQMECVYCHHNVEKSARAGIPSVELCMGCHSVVQTQSPEIQKLAEYYNNGEPVPWVRIHALPDHAHFNHRPHIEAGVACQECHGPIQSMPQVRQFQKLEMAACMKCHRQDQYADQVYHPPTYHEAEFTPEDISEGALVYSQAQSNPDDPVFQSASRQIEKYYADDLTRDEARAMMARLVEYKGDKYIHGRNAQLIGHNASVECSTCHY